MIDVRARPKLGALLVLLLGMLPLTGPGAAMAQEDDYEAWLRQQRQEYNEYVDDQEKAFLQFLESEWETVPVDTALGTPIDDKPRRIPSVGDEPLPEPTVSSPEGGEETSRAEPPSRTDRTRPEPEEPPPSPTDRSPPVPSEEEAREVERPVSEPPSSDPAESARPTGGTSSGSAANRETSLSFFGTTTTVPYGDALRPQLSGAPTQSSIQSFWKQMAEAPHEATLEALQERRRTLQLSDWGYYRYLRTLSGRLYDASATNERTLWTWFMLMKSGYAARVGYSDASVVLMLPIDALLYDRPQMRIDGQRYYLMADAGNSLHTYRGEAPVERAPLRLNANTLPALEEGRATRNVEFSANDQRHKLEIAYDPQTVEYLNSYPEVELDVLLSAGLSKTAQSSLTDALRPLVADRSPRAALNGLLSFAQFATTYKRDRDHFGEERFLFPEESLASDYSDCEDRAVLLSALVRMLLDRPVVGVRWPNHVALAVRAGDGLSPDADDQTYTVDGHTYILADPTYIGSSLGMIMPLVEGKTPKIIRLKQ
jgi:hypothetical protein